MDELKLINDIDNQLKEITGMTRNGHYQVQQVIDHFRKKARAEQAKNLDGPKGKQGHRATYAENANQNEDTDAR